MGVQHGTFRTAVLDQHAVDIQMSGEFRGGPEIRIRRKYAAGCLDTIHLRHNQVEKHDIRFELPGEAHGVLARASFADYLKIGLELQKSSEPLSYQLVVVKSIKDFWLTVVKLPHA